MVSWLLVAFYSLLLRKLLQDFVAETACVSVVTELQNKPMVTIINKEQLRRYDD